MSFPDGSLFYDDLVVNQVWLSAHRTITAADVVGFARLSGDFNPLHLDPQFASTTPFRQPIAHGLLVLAASSGLFAQTPAARTLAFLKLEDWQFKAPVYYGDAIHLRTWVLDKRERARGRRGVVTWRLEIINQLGKIVQEGNALTLVEGRSRPRAFAKAGEKTIAVMHD